MEVLKVIFVIASIIANASLVFFAVSAWFTLHRLQKDIKGMEKSLTMTAAMTMGSHIKNNFDELNKMNESFAHLVENEQYEEARKLHDIIANAKQYALESVKYFKELYGGSIAEIVVTQLEKGENKDGK